MKANGKLLIALLCVLIACITCALSPAVVADDLPELPTAEDMAKDPVVSEAIEQAWTDSQADDPANRHEEGGWIVQDTTTGKLSVVRFPKGTRDTLIPGAPPQIPCSRVVGHFHTHPNPPPWVQEPSETDKNFADHYRLPGIVKNAAGTESFGPAKGARPHTPLDHFMCYPSIDVDLKPINKVVYIEDQFVARNVTVKSAGLFCNPVEKTVAGCVTKIINPDHHLTFYTINYTGEPHTWFVEVDNQFGTQNLTVSGPVMLAVPTQKEGHKSPEFLDHFLIYDATGPDVDVAVNLEDEFVDKPASVNKPVYFATPVDKNYGGIVNNVTHLVFYRIEIDVGVFLKHVQVVNQFGNQTLKVDDPDLLAVPSKKKVIEPPPPLDHFKCYWAWDVEFKDVGPIGEVVYLEDHFGAVEAVVEWAEYFCNPVEKWHDGVPTPISNPDHHLTFYSLDYEEEPQMWQVEVDNQFGTQNLTVEGPYWLAVPTQKVEPWYHEPPVGLDHFLLYRVIEGPDVDVVVNLTDQFDYEPDVLMWNPAYFANPVQKTHVGTVTEIENPEAHLVFYWIAGGDFQTQVQVVNQFAEQTLDVDDPVSLGVPSEKLFAVPIIEIEM